MTEAEWLACDQPVKVARFARARCSPERFRDLAVEWGNHIRHLFEPADLLWFEAFAAWVGGTGAHPSEVCVRPQFLPLDRPREETFWARRCADAIREADPMAAAAHAGESAAADGFRYHPEDVLVASKARAAEVRGACCRELRDIVGNPFRPVTFSPEWRTSTAVALAARMYECRDFAAMPILADALQDAGCDSDDVLAHCRDAAATHVRGCWVVDLVLGKT